MSDRANLDGRWRMSATRALIVNLAYGVVLAAVSVMPSPPEIPGLTRSDWLLHGVAYMVQTLLLFLLFRQLTTPVKAMAASAGVALMFGVTMEFVQYRMPTRFFELEDMLANALGICVGMAVLGLTSWRYPRERGP